MYKKIFILALVMPALWAQADTIDCQSALGKSTTIISALLVDLSKNYAHTGGGGITEIKQSASDSFVVSIAQEERIDQFHYQIKLDQDCKVNILHKTETTKTPKSF